jgi:DHA1 family multidrug resistance protein-like MFS transporter
MSHSPRYQSEPVMERRAAPHANMGEVVVATQIVTKRPEARRVRTTIILLTASVALMMTGYGIIMPVFARRLAELGAGVEALGWMTMSFALAQLISAPFMGSMADRYGRRPLILLSLFSFILLNIGYLFAGTPTAYIAVRAVGGLLTAGLSPASMGMVADLVDEEERGKWIGIVMGGYGAGFVLGPVLGGLLYDGWGFAAPFIISALLGAIAFIAAFILVPETRTAEVRRRDSLRARRETAIQPEETFWQSLPRPLTVFGALLLVDFMASFAFAFVEPQMVFYLYDELLWSTVQFGVVVAAYGLAMMLGQIFLGQASDRFGRKPIIILGIILNSLLYVSIAFARDYAIIVGLAMTAGLGEALRVPATSANYLDISEPQHRARVLGVKSSALSLGGVLGPLAVVVTSQFMRPQGIFLTALALVLLTALIAALLLRKPKTIVWIEPTDDWDVASRRSLAAQASLRGIVIEAHNRRNRLPA